MAWWERERNCDHGGVLNGPVGWEVVVERVPTRGVRSRLSEIMLRMLRTQPAQGQADPR
jgi:hypothetical protein